MTPAPSPSSTARAPTVPNKPVGDAETYTFRAPRHGDLVACTYCANRNTRCCDFCGDEGVLFAIDHPENTQ